MERHRVFVVDEKNHELLGRIVSVGMLAEARYLLNQGSETRVVRRVTDSDGNRYLLFLPSAAHQMGIDASAPRPLLAGLAASTPLMRLEPRHEPGAQSTMRAANAAPVSRPMVRPPTARHPVPLRASLRTTMATASARAPATIPAWVPGPMTTAVAAHRPARASSH